MANPGVRVSSHRHIPAFILSALNANKPGILLLRRPEDAAISWAIYWNSDVEPCLEYYVDFHRSLKPYASDLFVAPFERVTTVFPEIIQAFNKRYGLSYNAMVDEPAMTASWISNVEALARGNDGKINEARVCRPSSYRETAKVPLREQLYQSRAVRRKLEMALELYSIFSATAARTEPMAELGTPLARPGAARLGRLEAGRI